MGFVMKDDDIFRPQKQANANFAKPKSKVKRKPVERLVEPDWIENCVDSDDEEAVAAASVRRRKEFKGKRSASKAAITSSSAPISATAAMHESSDDGSSELHHPQAPTTVTVTLLPTTNLLDYSSSSSASSSAGAAKKPCPALYISPTASPRDYSSDGSTSVEPLPTITTCLPPMPMYDLSGGGAPSMDWIADLDLMGGPDCGLPPLVQSGTLQSVFGLGVVGGGVDDDEDGWFL